MDNEKQFFIQVLADHLAKRSTQATFVINWDAILYYAKIHQVVGVFFVQCNTFMPDGIKKIFEKHLTATLFYYENRKNDYKKICETFQKEKIDQFTIKGLEIATCYPVPALRTMGDLDIIVRKEEKEKAGKILESLGFIAEEQMPNYDWHYKHNGLHYELHHQFIYNETVSREEQADFFNHFWDYVENGKLDWSFHFLFLIAHLRKHLLNSGAGFRMFMDIAAIVLNDPGLKWEWIESKLNDLDMGEFSRVCFALVEYWFEVKTPIYYTDLDEQFIENATEKIFGNGIFGFEDKRNQNNEAVNNYIVAGKAERKSRLHILARYLFPKYSSMRYVPYYQFLDGHPWILPVAWGYRIYRLLIGKASNISSFYKRIKIPYEMIDEHKKDLEKWGLK